MRWQFLDATNQNERDYRDSTLAKIDAWWLEFQKKTGDLSALFNQDTQWDLPQWMADHLQAIHPHLMWEYGPPVHTEGHRLVITPESRKHLRCLVDSILSRAPKIPNWEFYDYRLRENIEAVQRLVEGRTQGNIDDITVAVVPGRRSLIDLVFVSPRAAEDPDQVFADAYVATETLLGEQDLDRWVGVIDVQANNESEDGSELTTCPIAQLPEMFDRIRNMMLDHLPKEPAYRWIEKTEWTGFEMSPEMADDWIRQEDLFVGSSGVPGVWEAARYPSGFSSKRFSSVGETFCYLKIDGSDGLDEEHFSDRGDIDDALLSLLVPAELGCTVGGGTGHRYSYIDFALTDVNEAISQITRRLRDGNLTKRSWILFFDDHLHQEWVGVYPDSPEPLLPELED